MIRGINYLNTSVIIVKGADIPRATGTPVEVLDRCLWDITHFRSWWVCFFGKILH